MGKVITILFLIFYVNSITILASSGDSLNFLEEYTRVTNGGDSIVCVSNYSSEIIVISKDTLSFGSKERHYAFQGMSPFFYEDELYSIGGYGFWRVNPFLLKFTENLGWQAIEMREDYTPVINPAAVVLDSFLILIGGDKLADNSLINFIDHPFVQIINMKTLDVVKESKFHGLFDSNSLNDKFGKYVLIIGKNTILTIDVDKWTICEYDMNPTNLEIITNYEYFEVIGNKLIINGKYIFNVRKNKTNNLIMYFAMIIPILVLVTIVVLYKLKGQKHQIQEIKRHFDFPGFCKELHKRKQMLHADLFDFIESDLSYSHKSRIIRENIDWWNIALMKDLNLRSPVIIREKSEIDRRSIKYMISEEISELDWNIILKKVIELYNR